MIHGHLEEAAVWVFACVVGFGFAVATALVLEMLR